jgi:hypothetical protein
MVLRSSRCQPDRFPATARPGRHSSAPWGTRRNAGRHLTDDEKAAVDDGRAALDKFLEQLADVPAPAGPTPRQLGAPPTATFLPIVDVRQETDSLRS